MRMAAVLALLAAVAAAPAAGGEYVAGSFLGWREFRRPWVPAPEFNTWDGLGPLFNARNCENCHFGPALAGRLLAAPDGGVVARGLVVRLGDTEGAPDPVYGRQLQTFAVARMQPEARLVLRQGEATGGFAWEARLLQGPLAPGVAAVARLAPALVGRGALARVDAAAVEALAAAQAARGDGVAGVPRWIEGYDGRRLGRFGARADQPDLDHQIAWAFALDLGVSSRIVPQTAGDCTDAQPACLAAPHGADGYRSGAEVDDAEIAYIAAYLEALRAPAQLRAPPPGGELFAATGCATCHVPRMPAEGGGMVTVYSDLLLHDMGPGLDGGIGAPGVTPSQWRTTPLLALAPHPGRRYLHDGRAATLDAAIRAHGGEAAAAAASYAGLPEAGRATLIAFLEGL